MPIFKPRTIVASAAPVLGAGFGDPGILGKSSGQATTPGATGVADPRQVHAWDVYDRVGPIAYAQRYSASVMRRVQYFAAVVDPGNPEADPVPASLACQKQPDGRPPLISEQEAADANECIRRVRHETQGQGGIIYELALNMLVAGDGYVTAEQQDDGTDRWRVYSVVAISRRKSSGMQVSGTGSNWWVPDENGGGTRELAAGTYVARVYQPHPRDPRRADSAMMHVLEDAEEYYYLSRAVRGAARNRIAGNGLFLLPSEMEIPPDPDSQDEMAQARGSVTGLLKMLGKAMAAGIKDETAPSSTAPTILQGPGATLQYARHLTFDRKLDPILATERLNRLKVISVGLDLPQERLSIEGLADNNHWCSDEQTEVLTQRGWVDGRSVQTGDVALTLNHATGLSEWQPILDVYRADVTGQTMIAMEGLRHSSVTTPDHRWPVLKKRSQRGNLAWAREWRTSSTLRRMDNLTTATVNADMPVEAKHSDDLVELAAWYWTEGNDGSNLTIAQSHTVNAANVERIRACLTRLYGPAYASSMRGLTLPAWREYVQRNDSSHGGPVTVFRLNRAAAGPLQDVAPAKRVSQSFVRELTAAQIELFIMVSMLGDGWHQNLGYPCRNMWQRDATALDAIELAGILSGRTPTRGSSGDGHWLHLSPKVRIDPQGAAQKRTPGCMTITEQTYEGLIWCPVTPNGTWMARRRGTVYFTGNSGAQVAENEWNAHLAPLDEVLRANWTVSILRPQMAALGYAGDELERWVVGSDPTAAIEAPDKSANAQKVYDRFEMSGAALRKYNGFDEDDAPTPDEKADIIESVRLSKTRSMSGPEEIPSGDISPYGSGGSIAPPVEAAPAPGGGSSAPVRASAARQQAENLRWLADLAKNNPARLRELEAAGNQRTITAAAAIRRKQLGQQLAALDEHLLRRVLTGADAAMRRERDKAGSKIQQAAARRGIVAGGRRQATQTLSRIPKHRIAAELGRETVNALIASGAVDPIDDTAFDDYCDQVDGWVSDTNDCSKDLIAAAAAAYALRQGISTTLTPAVLADWQTSQQQSLVAGRAALKAALVDRLSATMFNPDPRVDDRGEYDPDSTVPASVIRPALNVYGGGNPSGDGPAGTIPAGSLLVAGGATMLNLAATGGLTLVAYEWRAGSPLRPFPPHEELDGTVFDNFDDPQLAVDDQSAWVQSLTGGLYPGDHEGCQCTVGLVFGEGSDF